ncbi:hypothetical protein OU789_02620 [Halocynthiibacter sp. C4]|uniref:hypothetical protein n=1 Tax=Halocynthiibacter sp. C4 TaxID=2992758 RepID=UPI00237AA547|nr:hypothetical protein [Halocynthiibacter sp. C4]MDE0588816.1 hypothetical protein [Halocynthiibacter sp. C4]
MKISKTKRLSAARHELAHAAACAVYAYKHNLMDLKALLEVHKYTDDRTGKMGGFLANQADGTFNQEATWASAVGPTTLCSERVVAEKIKCRNPYSDQLSRLDVGAIRKHGKDRSAKLLAPTFALLSLTGETRMKEMATILCSCEFLEVPLFDVFPIPRVKQSIKRTTTIVYNAQFNKHWNLMQPIPQNMKEYVHAART